MRKRVVLIGQYFFIGKWLESSLQEFGYVTQGIQFTHPNRLEAYPSDRWFLLDIHDFHQLTIEMMEIEPDVIIYIPVTLSYDLCEKNPELADLGNNEAVEHIKEIATIHNAHFILISSDITATNQNHEASKSQLFLTIKKGELILGEYKKSTIVRSSMILDNGPFGVISYLHSQKEMQLTNKYLVTRSNYAKLVSCVIKNSMYGVQEYNGEEVSIKYIRDLVARYHGLPYSGSSVDISREFFTLQENPELMDCFKL